MGNEWLAIIELGRAEPIHTFPGWKAIGRHVKKGAKAIELIMPVFGSRLLDQRDQRYGWSGRGSGNESEVEEIDRAMPTRGAPVKFFETARTPPAALALLSQLARRGPVQIVKDDDCPWSRG
jgi:hypothetical protein